MVDEKRNTFDILQNINSYFELIDVYSIKWKSTVRMKEKSEGAWNVTKFNCF